MLPPDEYMLETEDSIVRSISFETEIGGIPFSELKELIATDPNFQQSEFYTDLVNEEKEKLGKLLAAQNVVGANAHSAITVNQMLQASNVTVK